MNAFIGECRQCWNRSRSSHTYKYSDEFRRLLNQSRRGCVEIYTLHFGLPGKHGDILL